MAEIITSISNVSATVTSALVNGAPGTDVAVIRMDTFAGGTSPALKSVFKIDSTWYQVTSVTSLGGGVYDIGCIPNTVSGIIDNDAVSFVPDYTTITAWENGTDIALTANNIYVGELWGGGAAYSAELIIAGATVSGGNPTLLTHRKLRNGFGQRYNPITRTGAYLQNSVPVVAVGFVSIQEAFFEMEGIAVINSYTTEAAVTRYIIYADSGQGIDIHNCFVQATALDDTPNTLIGAAIRYDSLEITGRVYNNIICGKNLDNIGEYHGIHIVVAAGFGVMNNTIYGFETSSATSHCILSATGAGTNRFYNNACFNSSGTNLSLSGGGSSLGSNNFTGDDSGILWGIYAASADETFNYPAYEDFRLRYTSRAHEAGIIPVAGPNFPFIFTTDYTGATRTGLWDIGAYGGVVIPSYNPPTVEVKTIGSAGGRDYATIAAWETATRLHLVVENKVCIGELYADSLFDLGATLTSNANFYISGAVSDPTRYRELRAAVGQEYDPVADVGVQLRGNGAVANNSVVRINEDYFRLNGVQVEQYYSGNATRACIEVSANDVWVDRTVVRSSFGITGAYNAGIFQQTHHSLLCTNIIVIGDMTAGSAGLSRGIYIVVPALDALIYNCTVYRVKQTGGSGGYGINVQSGTNSYIRNCVVANCATQDFLNTGMTTYMYSCISTDATALGIGAKINQSAADMFNDPALRDFRLKAASSCLNAGENLQLTFKEDFIGQARTAPWEVGAYNGIVVEIQGPKTDRIYTMRYATCWKIERKDGFAIYATDHNTSLTLQGQIYLPTHGFDSSAVRRELGMKADDTEFNGAISSDVITHEDLRGGRYNEAKVTEYVVDWRYPWAQPQIVSSYYITSVQFDGEAWKATVAGISYLLQQKAGRTYNRQCDATLYDSRCKVVKASRTVHNKVVDSVVSRTTFAVTGGGLTLLVYKYGLVTWLTGDNVGIACEVRSHTAADITLQMQLPYDIQIGDTFDLSQGCAHTQAICISQFANIVNYRGYREVPGTDKQLQTPLQ